MIKVLKSGSRILFLDNSSTKLFSIIIPYKNLTFYGSIKTKSRGNVQRYFFGTKGTNFILRQKYYGEIIELKNRVPYKHELQIDFLNNRIRLIGRKSDREWFKFPLTNWNKYLEEVRRIRLSHMIPFKRRSKSD